MIEMFQPVISLVDVPEIDVKAGCKGCVVDIYSTPYPGFEVEFFDSDGDTIGFTSVKPEDIAAISPKHPARLAA
jgi:hypothetical protein